MVEEARISLSRTLVNHLLHAAQLQPSHTHWGLISGVDGKPRHCHILNGISHPTPRAVDALRKILQREGQQVWALYSWGPEEIVGPCPSELVCLDVPLFLAISLGTKGVLQLRGWRVDGIELQELGVTIKDG